MLANIAPTGSSGSSWPPRSRAVVCNLGLMFFPEPARGLSEFRRVLRPGFRTVPGLIRKQFIYGEDGWADGVYQWKTRADAEAFYSGPSLAGIRERYGMDPQIKYFHTACVTGGLRGVGLRR